MILLYELTDVGNWIGEDDKGMEFIGGVNIPDARNELQELDGEIEDMLAQGLRLAMHNTDLIMHNSILRKKVYEVKKLINSLFDKNDGWVLTEILEILDEN